MKGFDPKWCEWIKTIVQDGSVGVRVSDDIGQKFQTRKGLRQGGPLSPILFNIFADVQAILIARAKKRGSYRESHTHLVLQYPYDTILCLEHDIEKAVNTKLILCIFGQLSGLKINFRKSKIFCFGKAKDLEHEYK
jgi:retron-type reverse transcriptase